MAQSNSWGNGDIFARAVPEGPEAPTENLRVGKRVQIDAQPRTGLSRFTQFMWRLVFAGLAIIVFAFILAAIVGVVLGFVTGIAEVL